MPFGLVYQTILPHIHAKKSWDVKVGMQEKLKDSFTVTIHVPLLHFQQQYILICTKIKEGIYFVQKT